jgi:hypothetical protein
VIFQQDKTQDEELAVGVAEEGAAAGEGEEGVKGS